MPRIACLRIPRFQIGVHRKQEPELKGKPFVLIAVPAAAKKDKRTASNSNNRLSKILVVSEESLSKDIFAGMRLSEAQTICAEVLWRYFDEKLYGEVQRKIANELISCSPRIASQDPGTFLLDASGLRHLGGESKLCADVLKLVSKMGFVNGQIGVADSAFAALAASRGKNRWHLVPPGKDAEFLSRLPVSHLPVDSETMQIMSDLGIKLIGQFAQLSTSSVAERFGDSGLNAHKLARGIDHRQPGLPLVEKEFQCAIEMGGPVESLNETLFIMKSMLDRLVDSLLTSALCVEEMLVSFYNDNDLFDERPVRLIRPSNTTKFLLDVLRLSLEARPLHREFTGIRIVVSRFCNETWQQIKINGLAQDDAEQARELLLNSDSSMILLQKFYTRFGEHMLVKAIANDQYLPDSAGLWQPVAGSATHGTTSGSRYGSAAYGIAGGNRHSTASGDVNSIARGTANSDPNCTANSLANRIADSAANRIADSDPNRIADSDPKRTANGTVNRTANSTANNANRTINKAERNNNNDTNNSNQHEILHPIAVNSNYLNHQLGDERLVGCAVVKRHGSLSTFVQLRDGAPAALTYKGHWYQIKLITAPECLSGFWWDRPVRKSYYVALIEPKSERMSASLIDQSLVVLLAYHHEKQGWFVEGIYD